MVEKTHAGLGLQRPGQPAGRPRRRDLRGRALERRRQLRPDQRARADRARLPQAGQPERRLGRRRLPGLGRGRQRHRLLQPGGDAARLRRRQAVGPARPGRRQRRRAGRRRPLPARRRPTAPRPPIPWVQAFNQSDSGRLVRLRLRRASSSPPRAAARSPARSAPAARAATCRSPRPTAPTPGGANTQHNALQQGFTPNGPFEAAVTVASPFTRRRDRQRERRHLLRPGRGQLHPAGGARQRRHPGDRARHGAGRHLHPPRRPGPALGHRERQADAERRPRDQPGARPLPARRRLGADHRRPDRPGLLVRLAGRRRPGDHQGREREAVGHLHLRRLRDRRRHPGADDRGRAAAGREARPPTTSPSRRPRARAGR